MSKNLLERQNVIKVKKFLGKYLPNTELIELKNTARSALDASKALNVNVGSIVKSILFTNNEYNKYYLCLVSGDKFISIKKLSKITGYNIEKTNANECKNITGFSIGGVSPIAHIQTPNNIFIDHNLNRYDTIYAAAGHPHVVFRISFNNLCLITKGKITNIVI